MTPSWSITRMSRSATRWHALALVGSSDAHVVELGSVAQGEAARLVDAVPADLGVGQKGCPSMMTVALSRARQACIGGQPGAVCGRSSL